ncbi:hypothetical protein ACFQ1M_00650 [Sungkyunkwania multivorans]|uniref:Uncharacterized protein n=1 Tax=Sungkyunkwania multivorans TaxID=1173618 RepID=A0ABW3CSF4_9FLAO
MKNPIRSTGVVQIAHGALTLAAASFIIGGYLLLSSFLFDDRECIISFSLPTLGWLIIANISYFIFCLVIVALVPYRRSYLLKCAFGMLLNIPVAILYLFIVIFF